MGRANGQSQWAEPMHAGMTVGHDPGQPIPGCVPVGCHSWGHSRQRVVLAQMLVGANRRLTVHMLPVVNSGHPFMLKSTGTLVTPPLHMQTTAALYLLV